MSGSKDKYLADMIAIQEEMMLKTLRQRAGDFLAGAIVQLGLEAWAPQLLAKLKAAGIAPGESEGRT